MPRVSKKQVLLNREAIKVKASALFRERGIAGVGIPEITRAAGLTPGSFYGHFKSKDALVTEASDSAFKVGFELWDQYLLEEPSLEMARARFISEYLTVKTRDNPGGSGPIATLVGDIARLPTNAPVKKVFSERIGQVLDTIWPIYKNNKKDIHIEQKAFADLASIVGAMLLSRATLGTGLSEKFLLAVIATTTKEQVVNTQ